MGETRVDLVHLLEDLRDTYPGSLEETILTEIVANALDSGARSLRLETDSVDATLIAVDDGAGMTRRELSRYHDLGSTSKRRGRGIGFAGVGIKLGLLACKKVVTETRRGGRVSATSWRLAQRTRAPWSWIEPPCILESDGTAVLLHLSSPFSQLLDTGLLETTVVRHFQPLFEPEFIEILAPVYPHGFSIVMNDRPIVGPIRQAERDPIAIRVGRQRKPSGVGYLARHAEPLPEHERGLAISTLGKVIRRGWDWIGITPIEPDRIEGLIEVPALAEALTLNKGDFLRHGKRGALFVAYRKAIQEAVGAQFEVWGASTPLPKRTPRTRPIERDLRKVLGDLASDYPILATLADRRSGGQRRLPFADPAGSPGEWSGDTAIAITTRLQRGEDEFPADEQLSAAHVPRVEGEPGHREPEREPEPARGVEAGRDGRAEPFTTGVRLPGRARRKRPATLSLEIRFESRPDDVTLGRLVESTVWVNDAHPAYRRAVASRSEGYHIALTVASALAPFAVEPAQTSDFINTFLARWGAA
jgi:hypothetical protein